VSWKLLDISEGRANRGQFLAVFWFLIITSLTLNLFENALPATLMTICNIIIVYIALLMFTRRFRDIGYSGLILIILLFTAWFFHFKGVDYVTNNPNIVTLVLISLLSEYYIWGKGDRGENKYGDEPQGIDMNTMLSPPPEKLDENFHYDAFDEEDLRSNNRNKGKDE